jgi:hypothetical protein
MNDGSNIPRKTISGSSCERQIDLALGKLLRRLISSDKRKSAINGKKIPLINQAVKNKGMRKADLKLV